MIQLPEILMLCDRWRTRKSDNEQGKRHINVAVSKVDCIPDHDDAIKADRSVPPVASEQSAYPNEFPFFDTKKSFNRYFFPDCDLHSYTS
jgi:hypothetical protein